MADPISATVAFAVAAWSSAVTAVAGALTTIGVTAAIGDGAAIALAGGILKTGAALTLSAAATALLRPNTPSSGTALDFKPDPKAPVRGLMGYHATGGNKVFQSTWGYNGVAMSLGVALSLGPIDAITRFEADGALVSFTGAQNEAVGFYGDDMWQKTTLGLPTDAALLPPTGLKYQNPSLTGWGSQNAAKGVAFAFWTMVLAKNPEDRDIFVNGVPDPRWIGRWMKLYDWRKDSTYPGGSGSHREDDWRTWEWTENPYLHARAWLRGHFKLNDDGTIDRTRRIAGVGVPASAIDMAAFTEAANIAATNQWKISGEWSTSDNKWQVLAGMMQAGSGVPINRGAQVSVMVNTPRVSTYTYTRDDMVGQAVVRPLVRRRDRKNTVIPRYRSEQHKWEYVGAGEVTSSVYRDEDRGEPRTTEVQYTFVRDAKQAGQLAAYDLVNMREGLTVTLPSKVHLMHAHAGDCITVNVPEMALANQKVIVMRTTTDYKGAVTTLECRSETDGKHAFALGQAANPPPSPYMSAVDPNYIPPPLPVDVVVIPKPPSNGTSQPIIEVEIPVDRGDIAATVVEFALTSTGPWTSAGPADPSTGKYTLSGLSPNQEYWISVRYVANNGTISERYVTGPHIAPGFVADTINRFPDGTAPIWNYPTFADIPNPPLNDEIVAYVEDEGKLYRWDAANSVWTASVAASDINGTVPAGIDFGASLPSTGGYDKLFLNTTNKKLYRWDGSGWTAEVASGDIIGQLVNSQISNGAITDAKISGMAASKVTGQLTNAQIAAVDAAKVTGQITGTQISDNAISTPKLAAGAVETGKIAAGAVVADKIASNAVTAVKIDAGAVTTAKLSAGAVEAEKIAAGAVIADKIATNAVTADKVLASAITTDKLAANAVTTDKIIAGAIQAAQIGASAVTASKIAVSGFSLNPDPGYLDDDFWNWSGDYNNWYPNPAAGSFANKFYTIWSGFFTGTSDRYKSSDRLPAGAVKPGSTVITRVVIENNSNRIVVVGIEFRDGSGASIGNCVAQAPAGSGNAERISAPAVVPANTVYSNFVLYADAGAAFTGSVAVGGISVTEMSTGQLIVDGAITSDKIAANAVTADKITAGAVTAAKINVTELSAISANMGTITAGLIRSGTGGNRTEVDPNGIRTYVGGNLRFIAGQWT